MKLPPLYPARGALTICYPAETKPGHVMDVIFTNEFDVMPWVQDQCLDEFQRQGYTHITVGPIVAAGYHGWYHDTNWLGDRAGFVAYLKKLRARGIRVELFALPDVAPYFLGDAVDWTAVDRDLTPFYSDPEVQSLIDTVCLEWEWNVRQSLWIEVVKWGRRVFPNHDLSIHFIPDHAAPCLGSELVEGGGTIESEGAAWGPIVEYINGWNFQSGAAGTPANEINDDGRTPEEQLVYDAKDAIRRFKHGYAGWPTTGYKGAPLRVRIFEYVSQWLIKGEISEAYARSLGDAIKDLEGSDGYGDGVTDVVATDAAVGGRLFWRRSTRRRRATP